MRRVQFMNVEAYDMNLSSDCLFSVIIFCPAKPWVCITKPHWYSEDFDRNKPFSLIFTIFTVFVIGTATFEGLLQSKTVWLKQIFQIQNNDRLNLDNINGLFSISLDH